MVFLTEGNMKRQFFRVKQLADQTFARAEKTEALNHDLTNKEKRVDNLKQTCTSTHRKLQACLLGSGTDPQAKERRLKKLPQCQLGNSMEESALLLGYDTMLGDVLHKCGQLYEYFANHLVSFEVDVEKEVLKTFQEILEVDIPAVSKSRKQLNKLTLDYDAANSRFQAASKHAAQQGFGSTKTEGLKEEVEDAYSRMEHHRDTLGLEYTALLNKEAELSDSLHKLLKLQAEYHRKSLEELESIIPDVEKILDNPHFQPTYGTSLDEHLNCKCRKVAVPIEACVGWLLRYGMEEEGLFRIAGSTSKVKKLKSSFNEGHITLKEYDPHTVAGTLKQYLRELPEPLMTYSLYNSWMETCRHTDIETRLQAMFKVLSDLPNSNYVNLRYLIKFLSKLSASQDSNKMSCINIAIVIAPNLMWPPDKEQHGMDMGLANMHSSVVDCLISNADYFFPGEEDFYQGLLTNEHFEDEVPYSPLTCANGDEDRSGHDQHSLTLEPTEAQASGSSKSPSSNGSPKSTGSPKANRRPKKPAPPVPPQTRERPSSDGTAERNRWPKPVQVTKPRHDRKHSGLSTIELQKPPTVASDVSGVPPSEDQNTPLLASTMSRDTQESEEWATVTPRAVQPRLLDDARRASASAVIEKLQAQILATEKSKSAYVPLPAVPNGDVPAPPVADDQSSLPLVPPSPGSRGKSLEILEKPKIAEKKVYEDKSVSAPEKNQKQVQIRHQASLGHAPERPPRPQTVSSPPPFDSALTASSGGDKLNLDAAHCSERQEPTSKVDWTLGQENMSPKASGPNPTALKSLRHSTQSLDRSGKLKPPYANIPNDLQMSDKGGSEVPKMHKSHGNIPQEVEREAVEGQRQGSITPERPEKFDKMKNLPPARPEKSDRLRALLESQDPVLKIAVSKTNSDTGSAEKSKEKGKPARPNYSPSMTKADRVPPQDVGGDPANPSEKRYHPIYPSLSELATAGRTSGSGSENQSALPRSQVPSNAPSSPLAPRRPPRPQPRPPGPPPPVAKPRASLSGQPEETRL